ncbi:MAG TPA: MFS transporter [Anaerolineae bacterium]|nr:MFS transporter [Anaerolineae bacterium]
MRQSRVTLRAFVLILLCIEFWDEFVGGVREAVWPLIRDDLGLTYFQIGLLMSLPGIVSSVVEPVLGILGDVWKRRVLILGGGVVFALSLLLTGVSYHVAVLLLSFALFNPASGAFVSLSQATLMDVAPDRREQNMARWTLAGSLGVVAGPLLVGAAMALHLGWRTLFLGSAVLTVGLLTLSWRAPFPNGGGELSLSDFKVGVGEALRALRRGAVLRWLILLAFSDLMLDVLLGYLALYMVDVGQVSVAQAATAVAVWSGVGLLGDVLLIPLLERVSGLRYLRVSAVLELGLFTGFLLTPSFPLKLVLLALLGFFNSGWYSILKAQSYASLPEGSGVAMAVDNLFGLVGALIPWGLGLAAESWGLQTAMWLLLAGPLALLIGLPSKNFTQRRKDAN